MNIRQRKICENMKPKYKCDLCDYKCSTKFLWNQHLSTLKHKKQRLATLGNAKYAKPSKEKIEKKYVCQDCGKSYKQRSGLWRHKKTCVQTNTQLSNENNDLKKMMMEMVYNIQKDAEIKSQMMKQLQEQNAIIKNMVPMMGSNNNNKFNVNVFLNEKCRDAINMTDFIESFKIQLKDLIYTKKNGLSEGISSLFINKLKTLDTFQRPIHCTDIKRETIYIKDDNKWNKDSEKARLREAINTLASKQRKIIREWEINNPNWENSESKKDEYISIIKVAMGTLNNDNKIIKNIAKNTLINKNE